MIMTTIAPGHWLNAAAAAAYFRMIAAGCPTGGISEAGRTRARQTYIYVTWLAQRFWPIAQREFKATAARPGTSKHERGNALDLFGATLSWVRANGAEYGFRKDRVPGEIWHIEYEDGSDQHTAETVGNVIDTPIAPNLPGLAAVPVPLIPTVQEDDMLIIESPGALWTLTGDRLTGIADIAQANRLTDKGVVRLVFTAPEFKALRETTAGRELIVNGKAGYAVGTPGGRYIPLGDIAEVQVHQGAGCRQRSVSEQTFRNLTA